MSSKHATRDKVSLGIMGLQVQKTMVVPQHINVTRSNQESTRDPNRKIFCMNVGYPDFRNALISRGWVETHDKYDDKVDLKFAFSHTDIDYLKLKTGAFFNHCRAEGSMTSKTALMTTLAESQHYWATWLTNQEGHAEIAIPGYEKFGIDSFFPKSFVVTNILD